MTDFRPRVGLVGAARNGLALAHIIASNGHDVVLYTSLDDRLEDLQNYRALPDIVPELERLHDRVRVTGDPRELASQCEFIILTVTTTYFTRVLERIGDALDGAHRLVHAVHTLDGRDLDRVSQIVRRYSCVKQIGVIAGPTHVTELLTDRPNAAVVGSAYPEIIARCQKVLARDNLRVYGNPDIEGVEFAAALSQLVTIAVGIVDGLQLGAATHATLLTRGLAEIARIGTEFHATERTFSGLAGLGRVIDAVQRLDANYVLGIELGHTDDPVAVVAAAPPEAQGIEVARHVKDYADYHGMRAPITMVLNKIFAGELSTEEAMRKLMQLEQMDE